MKRLLNVKINNQRNLEQVLILPVIALVSTISYMALWFLYPNQLINISDFGVIISVIGAVATVILFSSFYFLKVVKSRNFNNRNAFYNTVSLSASIALTVVLITSLVLLFVSTSYKNLELSRLMASVLIGIYTSLIAYIIIPLASNINTPKIVAIFSTMLISGMGLSILTTENPQWWQINFSALGTYDGFSSVAFNYTMIFSGLIIISLITHLIDEINLNGKCANTDKRIFTLKILFIALGTCMIGVGLFPYNTYPQIHDFFGYSTIVVYGVIILSLRFLLPVVNKIFVINSYFALAVVIFCYTLFAEFNIISLTVYEVIAFIITLAWLFMFVRSVPYKNTNNYA